MDESTALRRQSLLIAIGCLICDGAPFLLTVSHYPPHPVIWLTGSAILVADLALALPARTAFPVAALHAIVRCGAAAVLLAVTGDPDNGIGNATGLVVAGYRAGAWLQGVRSWAALGLLIASMGGTQAVQGFGEPGGNILITLSNTVLPWMLGRHTTGRSGYIEDVRRRARAAVRDERAAIARDLHDTISHHVSAVGVHAAAARLGMSGDRVRAAASLTQVETSSRAAMSDLRRMLEMLHGDDADGVRQPGLSALPDLIEGSGLTVDPHVSGLDPKALPSSLDLAVYRIVQEMLTNALRHGDGPLTLTVTQTPDELRVVAENRVGAQQRPGTGRGLDGIHHRAELFGGRVSAGADGGTWHTGVTFTLAEPDA